MKRFFYVLFLAVSFFSCNREKAKNEIQVSGSTGQRIGEMIYFKELEPTGIRTLDSARSGSNGDFSFHYIPRDAGFYILSMGEEKKLVLMMEKGENAEITGDRNTPAGLFRIKGSPGSSLLQDFYKQSAENEEIADSLKKILKRNLGNENYFKLSISFDTVFGAIIRAQRELEKAYIRQHPGSLTSLLVLNFTFGPEPVLSYRNDSALFISLDSSLSKKYPGNKHVIYHHQRVMGYRQDAKLNKNL